MFGFVSGSTGTTSVSPKSKDNESKKKENKKSIKLEKAKEALATAVAAQDEASAAVTEATGALTKASQEYTKIMPGGGPPEGMEEVNDEELNAKSPEEIHAMLTEEARKAELAAAAIKKNSEPSRRETWPRRTRRLTPRWQTLTNSSFSSKQQTPRMPKPSERRSKAETKQPKNEEWQRTASGRKPRLRKPQPEP